MSSRINVRLPPDLDRVIRRIATQKRLTTSQIVRTLLRQAAGLVDNTFDAGFAEGLTAGEAAYLQAQAEQAARAVKSARSGR